MDLIMGVKELFILFLLAHYCFAMEEKKEKPLLERATSGFLAKIGAKKLKELPKELAVSSSSSEYDTQDQLRISNYLSSAGFNFAFDYQSFINAILDRDSDTFNTIIKKIEDPETKTKLCGFYGQLYQEVPTTPLPKRPSIDSELLTEKEYKNAAEQLWQEIRETKSQGPRVPLLDLTLLHIGDDSSESSSSQKATVIHTAIPLKPSAQQSVKEVASINTGYRLKSSNMKKEKNKETVSP